MSSHKNILTATTRLAAVRSRSSAATRSAARVPLLHSRLYSKPTPKTVLWQRSTVRQTAPTSSLLSVSVTCRRNYVSSKDEETPEGLRYTEEHEWLALEDGNLAVIGITAYASKALGDVVYVELPTVGASVVAGEPIGAVESVKSASDIYSPVSGEIIEVNEQLDKKPGLVNAEPYRRGWICKILIKDTNELESMMDNNGYETFIASS
ncbi:glycine cleavage H-protein-domain-containing protein [Lipomyces tetrasporus]|uniref:Glycine cleavage system H protein n=1 Tax=Lipomyces tetrasporus TaxID=54092 RepID=A0AAD7QZ51_9ASCO|nr:glycine cleavage H-protein-domain-containing protein [Lipomyces tetrasporus]KAJ8104083.1 glycine cleavage H-protein-domain-containing protein [Lipomyces tetrasporus]